MGCTACSHEAHDTEGCDQPLPGAVDACDCTVTDKLAPRFRLDPLEPPRIVAPGPVQQQPMRVIGLGRPH